MKQEKQYFVYIMASRSLNLYTGMCNNLVKRVGDHKEGVIEGFTKRYKINRLVYYETSKYINNTINREKQIKKWSRAKKIAADPFRKPRVARPIRGLGQETADPSLRSG